MNLSLKTLRKDMFIYDCGEGQSFLLKGALIETVAQHGNGSAE